LWGFFFHTLSYLVIYYLKWDTKRWDTLGAIAPHGGEICPHITTISLFVGWCVDLGMSKKR